jgi:hypothetical protein
MPRQIIDTESSRPAYRRRVTIRWIVILIVAAILIFIGVELSKAHRPAPVHAFQGNTAARVNEALLSFSKGEPDAA